VLARRARCTFNEPIPLARGRLGVAGSNGSLDPGRDVGRADDVRAHWHHAGAKPPRRARFQSGQEGPSLGPPEAGEGSMKEAGKHRGVDADGIASGSRINLQPRHSG
jgi:hypothetical protein